jgi:Spy/CpxP family protein refolding chaperone
MSHADILDEAAEREQQMIEIALANRKHPEMVFTGTCYYCEEAVQAGCFCSAECREDHERIERAKQQRRVA